MEMNETKVQPRPYEIHQSHGSGIHTSSPTYFEISFGDEIKKYSSSQFLPGRREIMEFCILHGIPVRNLNQIITFHIRTGEAYK